MLTTSDEPLFLGLDMSSQALKAIAITSNGLEFHRSTVTFSTDLPHHRGSPVNFDATTLSATTPARLFIEATDTLLSQLCSNNFPFHRVAAISGSAQQHGSVFQTQIFENLLSTANPSLPLLPQIPESAFSFTEAPTWQDASTAAECVYLETVMGGPAELACITGSRAYLRLTGPQILKRATKAPEAFANTSRISLISAFTASLFTGHPVPEDVSEASGTNMFSIASDPPRWHNVAVKAARADGLLADFPVEGWKVVGKVSQYMCQRYGFSPSTAVIAFAGDNPCTLAAGAPLVQGELLISLGTSDTAQWLTPAGVKGKQAASFGHVMRSATAECVEFLRMLVYSNGSLTKTAVRDGLYTASPLSEDKKNTENSISWEDFDKVVSGTSPGCNSTKVGIFRTRAEILPEGPPKDHAKVYNIDGNESTASHAELCRLVLEERALAIKAHAEALGAPAWKRVLLTGGASASKATPQIFTDVFDAKVYKWNAGSHSAALGAAKRARHGQRCVEEGQYVQFHTVADGEDNHEELQHLANPNEEAVKVYKVLQPILEKVTRTGREGDW